MEESVETEDSGISPGVVFLIAILSVGGLLFVGWVGLKGDVTGDVLRSPYNACCTVQPTGLSEAAYRQGTGVTSTELCEGSELPNKCCVRAGKDRFKSPVSLIQSSFGGCREGGPQISYPAYFDYPFAAAKSYSACCTTVSWSNSQLGFAMSGPEKTTTQCSQFESAENCCSRVASRKTGTPVKIIDTNIGACPQVSYPAGEYDACCTIEVRSGAPSGTMALPGQTTSEKCSPFDTIKDCCMRAGAVRTNSQVKFIGAVQGTCNPPKTDYPAPVNGYPVCCTMSTWQQAPIGYVQGQAQTSTESCVPGENPNMCCFRAGVVRYGQPVKLLGMKQGGCSSGPDTNLPVWVRP